MYIKSFININFIHPSIFEKWLHWPRPGTMTSVLWFRLKHLFSLRNWLDWTYFGTYTHVYGFGHKLFVGAELNKCMNSFDSSIWRSEIHTC